MGTIDIEGGRKAEPRPPIKGVIGDFLSSALVMAGNYRRRLASPFIEGVPVPKHRRVAAAVVNAADVALGDRHPKGLIVGAWNGVALVSKAFRYGASKGLSDTLMVLGATEPRQPSPPVAKVDPAPASGSGYEQTFWTGPGSPVETPGHPHGGVADRSVSPEILRSLGYGVRNGE